MSDSSFRFCFNSIEVYTPEVESPLLNISELREVVTSAGAEKVSVIYDGKSGDRIPIYYIDIRHYCYTNKKHNNSNEN